MRGCINSFFGCCDGPLIGIGVGNNAEAAGIVGAVDAGGGFGNTGGGLVEDSPEAGEAGELEAGDSTICNRFWPLSLSSLHSELGEADEAGPRRPRCQSLGARTSNCFGLFSVSLNFLINCFLSSGIILGSGFGSFVTALTSVSSVGGEAGVSSMGEAGVSTGEAGVSTTKAFGEDGVSKSLAGVGSGEAGESSFGSASGEAGVSRSS